VVYQLTKLEKKLCNRILIWKGKIAECGLVNGVLTDQSWGPPLTTLHQTIEDRVVFQVGAVSILDSDYLLEGDPELGQGFESVAELDPEYSDDDLLIEAEEAALRGVYGVDEDGTESHLYSIGPYIQEYNVTSSSPRKRRRVE
jgi:hypothetical protein